MDKRIKEIVKQYHIDEKRDNNIKNKERMFTLEREMAKLTLLEKTIEGYKNDSSKE